MAFSGAHCELVLGPLCLLSFEVLWQEWQSRLLRSDVRLQERYVHEGASGLRVQIIVLV